MTPAWAQRREALLSDCLVSPDIFHQMLDRLGEFVMPYQRALASEAAHHPIHLYARHAACHRRCGTKPARSSVWRCSTRGGIRCRTAGSRVMMN